MSASRRQPWLGLALWAVLVLPPVRQALEATMTRQVLVQLPLLGLSGWWLGSLPAPRGLAAWNRGGISGLLLASLAAVVWMLPRALDAALETPWVAAAKLASVPLLIGAPLAQSWPRAGFVVRGVFLMECVATAFRLGWLYLASPVRLCSNYLSGDQQRLGERLLALGAAITVVTFCKLVFGQPRLGRSGGMIGPGLAPARPQPGGPPCPPRSSSSPRSAVSSAAAARC